MSKIGLFGGSFDPVHCGHIDLAKTVLKKSDLDEVWFIPSLDQPFKNDHVESYENRLKLLKVASKNFKKIKVCDIEKNLPTPSYTYNTVVKLQNLYPNNKFIWIIGDDQIESLHKWYKIDALLSLIDFIVVNREGAKPNPKLSQVDFEYIGFDHPASSSAVRAGNFNYLPYAVMETIYKEELYFPYILKQRLSTERTKHVLSCVAVAKEIASNYNVNQTDLYKAVILHDITKELDHKAELEIIKQYFPQHLNKNQKTYHQYTAVIVAKKDFRIFDKNILSAIANHTTGDDISLLAMLTYVADKLERTRDYQVEHYIEMCKNNIYQGFKVVKADALKARKLKEPINSEK